MALSESVCTGIRDGEAAEPEKGELRGLEWSSSGLAISTTSPSLAGRQMRREMSDGEREERGDESG